MPHECQTDIYVSDPSESPQFLVRKYTDSHGVTRTVATRESPRHTWGPEHILIAEAAS